MSGLWSRRALLGTGAAAAASLLAGGLHAQTVAPPLRLAWIRGDDVPPASEQGVQLGHEEAVRLASLLGREAEVVRVDRGGEPAVAALRGFAALSSEPDVGTGRFPCVAIVPGAKASATFRVPSSTAARERAARIFAASEPAGAGPTRVVDWHPALRRYGAEQLNQRFAARFGAAMDEAAWAAWFAVKVLFETALRAGPEPDVVGEALARQGFDGHKGIPLRFDATRALRQPVYVVRDGAPPFEVAP